MCASIHEPPRLGALSSRSPTAEGERGKVGCLVCKGGTKLQFTEERRVYEHKHAPVERRPVITEPCNFAAPRCKQGATFCLPTRWLDSRASNNAMHENSGLLHTFFYFLTLEFEVFFKKNKKNQQAEVLQRTSPQATHRNTQVCLKPSEGTDVSLESSQPSSLQPEQG